MHVRRGLSVAAALVTLVLPVVASAQGASRENRPVDLPGGPAAEGFDIARFSNAGNGWFETFHVEKTESLRQALDAGRVVSDTRLLVMDTAAGKLALLADQMGYHHLAQGTAGGKNWLATF